jgi:hypothetical protein
MFHADRQTDMTKLTVTFRYFAKASNKQLRPSYTKSLKRNTNHRYAP